MKKHSIDPVDVMNNLECICELNRNNIEISLQQRRCDKPVEDIHTKELRALVRSKIPFQNVSQ